MEFSSGKRAGIAFQKRKFNTCGKVGINGIQMPARLKECALAIAG